MVMSIKLPSDVEYILETLVNHGHEAYIVGGCIRDILMGKEPKDWDLATSALPEEVIRMFNSFQREHKAPPLPPPTPQATWGRHYRFIQRATRHTRQDNQVCWRPE
jgi:hypothetical protein